jgi:CheY-like chemotaxis protein
MDDEAEVIRIVEAVLAPALTVEGARDGVTVLHRIQANPPDLLLLDLRLPDMEGLHVLGMVRRMHPDLAAHAVESASVLTLCATW